MEAIDSASSSSSSPGADDSPAGGAGGDGVGWGWRSAGGRGGGAVGGLVDEDGCSVAVALVALAALRFSLASSINIK